MPKNKAQQDAKHILKQEVWEQRTIHGKSTCEIAKMFGMNQKTVYNWIEAKRKEITLDPNEYAPKYLHNNDARIARLERNGDNKSFELILKFQDQNLRMIGGYSPEKIETSGNSTINIVEEITDDNPTNHSSQTPEMD